MAKLILSNTLEFSKVDRSKSVENHLLVTIKAPVEENAKRVPVQLVLVLDVSGSMAELCSGSSNTKIEVMKIIAKKMVNYLRDEDKVSIVTFDSSAKTVVSKMPGKDKESILSRINSMHPGSMTNGSAGIMLGYEAVDSQFNGSTRILFMSDGHINQGIILSDELVALCGKRPANTVLSTFGFGNAAQQDLLASMAKEGGGNYHFIENPDQVRNAFAEELGGAISCVAQNIRIEVTPNKDVEILEVLNDFKVEDNNGVATVIADDIFSGENKNVLIKLKLPSVPNAKPRPSTVVTVKCKWNDTATSQVQTDESVVKVEYVKEEDADKQGNLTVCEQIAVVKTAKAYEEASRLADKGNFGAAADVCRAAGGLWEKMKGRGSTLAVAAIANNEETSSSFSSDKYTASFGNQVRYSSRNTLRSRSSGTGGSSMLNSKGAVVGETLKAFKEDATSTVISTPSDNTVISPPSRKSFAKEKINK